MELNRDPSGRVGEHGQRIRNDVVPTDRGAAQTG
jgi:hypothetical protein